ncbi:MAG TPA: hypothetical protein VGK92_09585 [Gaiellales bacterium]
MAPTIDLAAPPVHVVNGDSVALTLPGAGLGGDVVVWRDVLHEGSFPPTDPAIARRLRSAFLAAAGFGSAEAIAAGFETADAALPAALAARRETVLWFEHDLHDQLQLVQILERIARHPQRSCARLLTIDRHPAHPRFAGLGELSASELGALWPLRSPLAAEAFARATRVCEALRAARADALTALAREPHAGLPYLGRALARLLEERPWADGALGRSERQILRAVEAGAATREAVFAATWAMEEAPYMGDSWLWRRLAELARRDRPLLATGAGGLELTAAGRLALAA